MASSKEKLLDDMRLSAIGSGLEHLMHDQAADGSWGTGRMKGNVAVTSLGALAFLAGGHQPDQGQYGQVLSKALGYVLQQEQHPPGLFHNPRTSLNAPMYEHAFAVQFLARVHGRILQAEKKAQVAASLDRAVKIIVDAQNFEGGWRYQPVPRDADLSVTCCQIYALVAAKNAGSKVPEATLDKAVAYIKRCQHIASGGFCYQRPEIGKPGPIRTAVAVASLQRAGLSGDEMVVARGLAYLNSHWNLAEVLSGPDGQVHYFYGVYFGAHALWHAGGRYRSEGYTAIRDELLIAPAGNRRPEGYWHDTTFCPHYGTAMALIVLQIPSGLLQ